MALSARRQQQRTDIWPGFVDALATLLMVVIFLLMIFVLAQFFLSEALSGRDQALDRLRSQVSELADLLALERTDNQTLRANTAQLADELQATVAARDDLSAQLQSLTLRAEAADQRAAQLRGDLEDAFKTIVADKEKVEAQLNQLAILSRNVEALEALRDELRQEVSALSGTLAARDKAIAEKDVALAAQTAKLDEQDSALKSTGALLTDERRISEAARAEAALLNRQIKALRVQISNLSKALDVSEKLTEAQKVQIANLGQRLNAALASKVQELTRYRSEFFGRLRAILGNQSGVRIVDRFVFQSEVLFGTGSAELGAAGQDQLLRLAATLLEISEKIPEKIDWILRVDGHTDRIPIRTARFPSNWELSTARAISVVRFLINSGVPAERLGATGFGEFQPIDPRSDEIANRRNRRIEFKLTQR
ncbi:MAG: peptidoglycan -binding protein [Proteobacteria bacterium]|nr:peptidoglycan -binding protein [Pseudomonadota bacterium]